MKWHLANDYHNSREYDGAPGRGVIVSQARLTLAWLVDAMRRQVGRLLKPQPAQTLETIMLKPGDHHGFTVLGAVSNYAFHESALTCPFPEQDEGEARRRSKSPPRHSLPADDPRAHAVER